MTNLDNSSKEAIVDLFPYYVYELLDMTYPENPNVLYVGKGVESRVFGHARVVAEKMKTNPASITSDKEIAIMNLLESKELNPDCLGELVIGRYASESEALAVESTLIKWVYGHDELKNKVHGHHANQIRNKGDFNLNSELQPKKFSEQRDDNIEKRGIKERAEDLKIALSKMGFLNIYCSMFGRLEYGVYWPVPDFPVTVQIKMQESNAKVVMNARPSLQSGSPLKIDEDRNLADRKKNHIEYLELIEQSGYLVSARDGLDSTFAALFESTVISGRDWADEIKLNLELHTGQPIEMRTSIQNGLEALNIVAIGSYLRDLEIRLTIAKHQIELNKSSSETNNFTKKLIRLFQSKPATKYFSKKGKGLFG